MELRSLRGHDLRTRYQPALIELLEQKFEEAEAARQEAEDKLNEYSEGSTDYLQWEQEHEKPATTVQTLCDAQPTLFEY